MTSEVVPTTPILSEDQLSEMRTFEDAVAILAAAGITVTDAEDYGDGFSVMEKDLFVKVPFILVDYKFVAGDRSDYGSDFVVVRLVTMDGRKGIITDGSTGIRDQIRNRLMAKGVPGGVQVKRGLTVSEYTVEVQNPKTGEMESKPAKTYYIDGM